MQPDHISQWKRFKKHFLYYQDLGISLDISRMHFDDSFFDEMAGLSKQALSAMRDLEAGTIANRDEKRMVGHYWLRKPGVAPNDDLKEQIEDNIEKVKKFASQVLSGELTAPGGSQFNTVLLIGIGGSVLGPQLVEDALTDTISSVRTVYFDNTDPDGLARDLASIGEDLSRTLVLVISKSGGTPETRNGMVEARAAFDSMGLDFARQAVAVTGEGSQLHQLARQEDWLYTFRMDDWVGGRTSVMSVVGLLPAALSGIDIDAFLEGAALMDEHTRNETISENMGLILALMWYSAGNGKGEKDMVILPYKDRLVLLSKYLQQLVMESLGKRLDLDGNEVFQGIVVYGNKGSTDQHAYVQQLRDGLNNFFATFIEVRRALQTGSPIEVEEGVTSGDYLQGFLRGTREALAGSGRESITLSIPELTPLTLGALIALFERAVTFYASLVNINAYHQPGVEAGKKAAADFLDVFKRVRRHISRNPGARFTAQELAEEIETAPEEAFHILNHLAANTSEVTAAPDADGDPAEIEFSWSAD